MFSLVIKYLQINISHSAKGTHKKHTIPHNTRHTHKHMYEEKKTSNGNNKNITITTKSTTTVAAVVAAAAATATTATTTTAATVVVTTPTSNVLNKVYRTRTGTPDAKNKCNKKFIGKRCTLTVSHIISFIFSLAWFHAIHTRLFTAHFFLLLSSKCFFFSLPYDQLGKHIWLVRVQKKEKWATNETGKKCWSKQNAIWQTKYVIIVMKIIKCVLHLRLHLAKADHILLLTTGTPTKL